jgi:platelet-activating factor acetylhydrolase
VLGAALLGSYFQPSPAATSETNDIDSTPGSETGVNAESGEGSGRVNGPGSPLFPVIVFSHGLGAMRTTYSGICCDLASHGYVVASVEHRDRSACGSLQRVPSSTANTFQDQLIEFYHRPETEAEFPLRNKQVLQRSRDGILALELLTMLNEGVEVHNMMEGHFDFRQFQGRLDLRKAAIMGHSFGGATTIQALSQDHRFMCGIALDCWMVPVHRDLLETGVQQPLLFINSFTFQWPDSVRKMMKLTRPPQHTGASACTILTLQGTSHTNQSDMPFVIPKLARRFTNMESALDPVLAHGLNMDICHAFFKRYLLRDPAYCEKMVPNLDGCEGHSDHIIFGSNVDVSIPSEDGATHLATGQAGGNKEQGDVAGGANEPGKIVEMAEEKAQTETETLDSEHAAKL